ncbi:MAG: hypothetical protein ACOCQQ_02605, partial [Candidatus Nanoarchaeia archaeon]
MQRKKFSYKKTTIVLILTIFIFALGIFLGNTINDQKVNTIVSLTNDLQFKTLEVEVEYDILEENLCDQVDVLSLTKDLYELADRVEFMEQVLGLNDPKIKEAKRYYFTLEAKHWLLAKKKQDICFKSIPENVSSSIILYFYANDGSCTGCNQQGTVLSYMHQKHPGMKIYSFDATYDTSVVAILKKIYGVESVPHLVINDESYE